MKQVILSIFIILFLVNFAIAAENDFSSIDRQNNFLVTTNPGNFYRFVFSDFIYPLALDKEELKKNVLTTIENNKKKNNSWRYVVKKGDTLSHISIKFKVPLNDLLSFNNLNEKSIIKVGDKIMIPGIKPQAIISTQIKKYAGKFVSALKDAGDILIPVSGFNWGRKHGNNATDIAAPCGSEVYASNFGTVVESSDGWNSGYGNYIIIKHQNGSYSLYGHLSLRIAEIGDEVKKGELIGYVGNTGYTIGITGCHLHFEIRGANNPLLK